MTTQKNDDYLNRGVDRNKTEVHAAVTDLPPGLFTNTFCKVHEHYVPLINTGHGPTSAKIYAVQSSDTAGTKPILAYLYYKETGSTKYYSKIAQDAIVMNSDDLLCVGAYENFMYNSTISRNKNTVPGEVLKAIIDGANSFCESMKFAQGNGIAANIYITYADGETADVGNLIRTVSVDGTMWSAIHAGTVIRLNIKPGDIIVGLASSGQATYETEYNAGGGCNGYTSMMHDVLCPDYRRYTETYDPATDINLIYRGKYHLTDPVPEKYLTGMHFDTPPTIADFLCAPTRTYLPIFNQVFQDDRICPGITGIVHNTGGGLLKCLNKKWLAPNATIIKDNLHPMPPLFKLIQDETNNSLREMEGIYNCGTRMEIYFNNESNADRFIYYAKKFGIDARIIGGVVEKTGEYDLIINLEGRIEYFSYDNK